MIATLSVTLISRGDGIKAKPDMEGRAVNTHEKCADLNPEFQRSRNSRGKRFAIVEKNCTTPELQELALKTVEEATVRRWRYMNGVYWYALQGKVDDTPPLI